MAAVFVDNPPLINNRPSYNFIPVVISLRTGAPNTKKATLSMWNTATQERTTPEM